MNGFDSSFDMIAVSVCIAIYVVSFFDRTTGPIMRKPLIFIGRLAVVAVVLIVLAASLAAKEFQNYRQRRRLIM